MNSTPTKLTPIFVTAQKLGARFAEQSGWQIPQSFGTLEDEMVAARQRVTIADMSANGKILVEGQHAESVLREALDVPALTVGHGEVAGSFRVFRLRADQYFLGMPPGSEEEAKRLLVEAVERAEKFVTVTDITHGRSELLILGPASTELLSQLCGLDFHPAEFPVLAVKQSSVAKTTQLIMRHDRGEIAAYALVGSRSVAAYLWETIMVAGRGLGIEPIGQTAIESL